MTSYSSTLLTSKQAVSLGIVEKDKLSRERPTTIDSSIGKIILKGGECKEASTVLPPRGIAWIVSNERFKLPKNVTGVTTLRTDWTRKGILTLTVGIVDPGYDGYLSTAVINFSKSDFVLAKGSHFFRTVFFKHEDTEGIERTEDEQEYIDGVVTDSAKFSETFLTIDTLVDDLSDKMFSLPRWAFKGSLVGLFIAVLALALTPTIGFWTGVMDLNGTMNVVESEIDGLWSDTENIQDQVNLIGQQAEQIATLQSELVELQNELVNLRTSLNTSLTNQQDIDGSLNEQ